MSEICQHGFGYPEAGFRLAQLEGLTVVVYGLFVFFLLVADYTQLGVYQGIGGVYLQGFLEGKGCGFEIVGPEILHTHVEMGLGATWEQPHNGPVYRHRLIRLVLDCKRMSHPNPSIQETSIQHNRLLEILSRNLKLLTMEIIGPHREPADRMTGIILHQVMCTVVEIPRQAQIQKTGNIDGQNLEAEGIFPDGFEAEFVSGWDFVVLVVGFGLYTKNVDVVFLDQGFEDCLFSGLLVYHYGVELFLFDVFYFGGVDLLQPLVLYCKFQGVEKFLLLSSRDKLTINQSVKCLKTCRILLQAFLITLHSHILIFLSFITLRLDKSPTALHLPIKAHILQLQFEDIETLLILFIQQQSPCGEKLETDILSQHLICLKERMHTLIIPIAEIAFPHQVDNPNMVI